MKKILNERLKILSAHITNNEKIIDIGCDHGLLGIYLFLNREKIKVVLSDINEKPLMKAKENLAKYNLENKIAVRCADGLEALDSSINTVIISGMGAINMVNILKDIKKYPSVSKLLLSPNNDFPYLRREIMELGFKIVKEEIVKEKDKFYLIIEFTKGKEKVDAMFGKLDLSDSINQEYFLSRYENNQKIIEKLKDDNERREELLKENQVIKDRVTFSPLNTKLEVGEFFMFSKKR